MRLATGLLRAFGWRVLNVPSPGPRVVIIAYPHTSNWDIFPGLLWGVAAGAPLHFVAKKSLFRFPLGPLLRAFGGLPLDRAKVGGNFVDAVADLIRRHDRIVLAVAPEGTRARGEYWRTGFYHMAQDAGVPIGLAALDWGRREVGVGLYLHPTGDMAADFEIIRAFYAGRRGRDPSQETPIRVKAIPK